MKGRISPLVFRSKADKGSSISNSFGCESSARPIEQRPNAEQVDHLVEVNRKTISGLFRRRAEQKVAPHRKMRKKPRLLKDVAEWPLIGRDEGSISVLPGLAVDI